MVILWLLYSPSPLLLYISGRSLPFLVNILLDYETLYTSPCTVLIDFLSHVLFVQCHLLLDDVHQG